MNIRVLYQLYQVANSLKGADVGKVKSGIKTSEFWVALLGAVIPVINIHLGLNVPLEQTLAIAGITIAYIISRGQVKKEAAK